MALFIFRKGGGSLIAESVIDLQVEAFNRGDADAFAATYAPDAIVRMVMSDDPPLVGRGAIRDHYAAMFAALPNLTATVEERLVVGHLITDHERISDLGVRALVTYEVEESLIRRAWLFGPLPA